MNESFCATRDDIEVESTARVRQASSPFEDTVIMGPSPDAPEAIVQDPWIGKTVAGRYRIEALLGEGGMGRVYRAEHVHMQKIVALKVLHLEMSFVPEAVARFEREAVAAGRVTHRNVASALDFGRIDAGGQFYLALEYVEGRSLRDVLDEVSSFSAARSLAIVRQVAAALQAAHEQGIVHRDLKPENIMLVSAAGGETVKVLDFGIAKVLGDAPAGEQLTRLGAVFGSPEYMSPEQAAGQPVDQRSDLYALGVILYEMLTGLPPFLGESVAQVLGKHLEEAPAALPSSVPLVLNELAMSLLAKLPEQRPVSAGAVVRALQVARLSILPAAETAPWRVTLHRAGVVLAVASVRFWQFTSAAARSSWRWSRPRLWQLGRWLRIGGRAAFDAAVAASGAAIRYLCQRLRR